MSVSIGSIVKFVDPWSGEIVGAEVIEVSGLAMSVDYQGNVIVLSNVTDTDGVFRVVQY